MLAMPLLQTTESANSLLTAGAREGNEFTSLMKLTHFHGQSLTFPSTVFQPLPLERHAGKRKKE